MEETEHTAPEKEERGAFRKYAWIRIIVGILITVVMLWVAGMVLGFFQKPGSPQLAGKSHDTAEQGEQVGAAAPSHEEPSEHTPSDDHAATAQGEAVHGKEVSDLEAPSHKEAASAGHGSEAADTHGAAAEEHSVDQAHGVAFVNAVIEPLHYELSERFWGWRPNDIIKLGDNVINFQLGALEVARRAAIQLNDRLSRTSTTAKIEPELESAMNWFMVKPDQYWFPSPETKYMDSLEELEIYKERLTTGDANFFARTDNLIPLLASFVALLGSCDENLVKMEEKTGEPIPFYKADDYFFYAKGVATGMYPILEAIMQDFNTVLVRRDGVEILHHAIENLERAMHIDPWVITDADLGGVLANHRANMAAPISHAMVYLYTLMKTLET